MIFKQVILNDPFFDYFDLVTYGRVRDAKQGSDFLVRGDTRLPEYIEHDVAEIFHFPGVPLTRFLMDLVRTDRELLGYSLREITETLRSTR